MNIFISYCHQDHKEADIVDSNLLSVGINVIRDIRDLSPYTSLKKFMSQSVSDSDKIILIISDDYLKSKNCMFEILEVMRFRDYEKMIIPIVLSNANKIFQPKCRIDYIKYWSNMEQSLKKELEKVDWQNHAEIVNDLSIYSDIKKSIGNFCSRVTDLFSVSIECLEKSNFRELLEFIGHDSTETATKVLQIINNYNVEEREMEIESFIENYGKTKYADFLKGVISVERKLFNKAKIHFLECIKKDDSFDQARIYLANIYMFAFKDYKAAEKEYLAAIQNKPNIRAFNNLGILYHYYLHDPTKAESYYKSAISIDPFYRHPFYNLGNLYRVVKKQYTKAEKCYRNAIELDEDYGRAYNGLGIIKMEIENDKEEALHCFEKALKSDPSRLEYILNIAEYYCKYKSESERVRFYYEYALLFYPDNKVLIKKYLDYINNSAPNEYGLIREKYLSFLIASDENKSSLDMEEVVFLMGEPVVDQIESSRQRIIDYRNIR